MDYFQNKTDLTVDDVFYTLKLQMLLLRLKWVESAALISTNFGMNLCLLQLQTLYIRKARKTILKD